MSHPHARTGGTPVARRPKPPRAALLLALLSLTGLPAAATTLRRDDAPTLLAGSQQVVVGRVVAVRPHWDTSHRRIVTDVSLAVLETIKGAVADSLTLTQLGGEVDGVRYAIEGSPEFKVGDEALLFVWRDRRGRAQVNGLAQGRFGITRDRATGARLLERPLPGLALRPAATGAAARRGGAGEGPSLDDAVSTLRRLAGSAASPAAGR